MNFSKNSLKVMERRYLLKNTKGETIETPTEMFHRVSRHVAQVEEMHGGNVDDAAAEFYELLAERRFFPNSPTFTGAGTPLGQLAACFVLPLADDMGKDPDGIFNTLRNAALIQQTGGGNGFSFSRLRPKGDIVHASNGQASGPISFLRAFDGAFNEVHQGGVRRGANMAVLHVSHPDIEEFIECKSQEGDVENFNISVAISDAFMRAVQHDSNHYLVNPRDGSVWKTIRARDLWDAIVRNSYHIGEPGVLFIDAANRSNPLPHLYDLEATNPCVTGDTLISTQDGLKTALELYQEGFRNNVLVDSRFGDSAKFQGATHVFKTGTKAVYKLKTVEGYEVKATRNHQIMTPNGWVEMGDLKPGQYIHICNQKGGFGSYGSLEMGRVLGWLCGDGYINSHNNQSVLYFCGEKKELTSLFVLFVEYVNSLVPDCPNVSEIGTVSIDERDCEQISSSRLTRLLEPTFIENKLSVPKHVLQGSQDMQRGFLQGLFSSDGTCSKNVEKGINIRLSSISESLLINTQRLLLNFGIASRIYLNRSPAKKKVMPDGNGGQKMYDCKAIHELAISKQNLNTFFQEINFLVESKACALVDALDSYGNRGPYKETFKARVESVEYCGEEDVYDLTEPNTRSFIANGIVVHNCGEQWLGPYENCCLGSVNLAQHVKDGAVDWLKLANTVRTATHFLDNVVDANAYVPAVPQLRDAALKSRRIGEGFMGLADMMYMLRIRYGSEEGQEFAAQISEFMRYVCMDESIRLAKERSPFPALEGSIYDHNQPGGMKWQPPKPIAPYTRYFGRPDLDWNRIVDSIRIHGIRNAAQMTVAPTGTIATVCGTEGYGCEPVFALGYTRHFKDGEKDVELHYTSPLFEAALNETDLSDNLKATIKKIVAEQGSCQGIVDLPSWIRNTFVVSGDINAVQHVRMQAEIQAFIDNSLSKTCNFPADATEQDVADAYELGWKLGCKGMTVYVTGSRDKVVLETKATQQAKAPTTPRKRPAVLTGTTYRKQTPLGNAYVTINEDDSGNPFEVFLNVGKAGSETAAVSEGIGRIISLFLRSDSNESQRERLSRIADELTNIGSGSPLGLGAKRVRSLVDGIGQVLSEYLQGETDSEPTAELTASDLCPECGEPELRQSEGCATCTACGYSKC